MPHFPRGLPLLICAALATACGSAAKRAGEYMEKGLYDDAIRTYEEILRKDPNDTDAAAGLRNARSAWTDRRLIDVRMARLAGTPEKSLDLLLEVTGREAQWKTPPSGKLAFTQNEETLFGMAHAEKVAAESIAQKHPLKGEAFLLKYRKLFEGAEVARRFDAARARSQAAGKLSCQSFLPAAPAGKKKGSPDPVAELALKHPYYYGFLRTYCDYWGVNTPAPSPAAEKYREAFAGRIQVSATGVSGLPADLRMLLADQAKSAFERSAWFDSAGAQSLTLNVAGAYTFADSKVPRTLQHVYTEKEPYTEYVEVQKSREVSYTALEGVFDPLSKTQQQRQVTKTRTEYYTTSEPQTRYRDVKRTYHYQGWQHDRKLSLSLSAGLEIEKRPIQLDLSEVSQSGGLASEETQPAIGLGPVRPQLEDPPTWLRLQSGRFVGQFEQKLAGLWKETHCQPAGNEDVALGDSVHKCLRQKMTEFPELTEAWYRKNLGVGVGEARFVMGERK